MEVDGAVDVLEGGGIEKFAGDVDHAGDVRQCEVVRVALDGDAAVDAVSRDGCASAIDVGSRLTSDGGEFDVAVVGGGGDGSLDRGHVDIAAVGGDGSSGRRGNRDDKICARAFQCGHGDGDGGAVRSNGRAKLPGA